jgi:GNAT superfamily N-acetyltransferase
MKSPVVVREATVDDAEAIARVHVASWRSAYRGLVPEAVLNGLSVERRTTGWKEWLDREGHGPIVANSMTWVAEVEDVVCGFANAGPCRDEDATDRTGEVHAIYITEDVWDAGVGAALMNAAVSWLRERFAHATLWVLEGNARGRAFYEKGAWAWDGTRQTLDFDGTDLPEIRYRIDF